MPQTYLCEESLEQKHVEENELGGTHETLYASQGLAQT